MGLDVILFILFVVFMSLFGRAEMNKRQNREEEIKKKKEEEILKEQERIIEKRRVAQEKRIRECRINSKLVLSLFPAIQTQIVEIEKLINYDDYFKSSKLNSWKDKSNLLFKQLHKISLKNLEVSKEIISTLEKFLNYYNDMDKIRKAYNENYVRKEMQSKNLVLFEGKKLDENQRKAVVINEDNNLIVAAAGAGKTTVITAKVRYLIENKGVNENEILLLSFTRKACDEMNERLKSISSLKAITFHHLGLSIIGDVTNNKPSIFDEKNNRENLKTFLKGLLKDPNYSTILTEFMVYYSKPLKPVDTFSNHGEYIEFMRENGIKSYKKVTKWISGRMTILREQCKSIEEVIIANYLFINGIEYEYERKYEIDTADATHTQYRPDFYLTKYGIYIEHFGLDLNGNVPRWFGKDDYDQVNRHYQDSRKWKLFTHKIYRTKLIETFSHENSNGNLLVLLEEKLRNAGVEFCPMTNEEIWNYLDSEIKEDVDGFYDLISSFHSLFKAGNYTFKNLNGNNFELNSVYEKERITKFLKLYRLFYNYYKNLLLTENVIDFNDMINNAYHFVISGEYKSNYKYILVDEYQDISISRYNLLKALKDQKESTTLFCVGDDWQSIYRFAGSDLNLFTKFSERFGETSITKIGETYRFKKDLVKRSSSFIQKNTHQISKEVNTTRVGSESGIQVHYNSNLNSGNFDLFYNVICEIGKDNRNTAEVKIMILGRYSYDITSLLKESDEEKMQTKKVKNSETGDVENEFIFPEFSNLKAHFYTVHKSKGKEADYVILLNCVSGKRGFPSQYSDDPILNLVLSEGDTYPNAEERRLFYVAITRAKEITYVLSNSFYKSKFAKEIDENESLEKANLCPRCVRGELFLSKEGTSRKGNWQLFKCKNFTWGCDYFVFKNPDDE